MSLDPWGQPVVVATDDSRTNGLTCLLGTFIVFRCQALEGRPFSIFLKACCWTYSDSLQCVFVCPPIYSCLWHLACHVSFRLGLKAVVPYT